MGENFYSTCPRFRTRKERLGRVEPGGPLELALYLERAMRSAPTLGILERWIQRIVARPQWAWARSDEAMAMVRKELWPAELDRRYHRSLDRLGMDPNRRP